jgi:hypothetical protein
MLVDVPVSWLHVIGAEVEEPYFQSLSRFVDDERGRYAVTRPATQSYGRRIHHPSRPATAFSAAAPSRRSMRRDARYPRDASD